MEKLGQLVLRKYTSSGVYDLDGKEIKLNISEKQKMHCDWEQKMELHFGREIELNETLEWGNETFFYILAK